MYAIRSYYGPEGAALESELAAMTGAAQAVAVASGTDALHLALRGFCCANPSACGDDPPDEACADFDEAAFCAERPGLCNCEG